MRRVSPLGGRCGSLDRGGQRLVTGDAWPGAREHRSVRVRGGLLWRIQLHVGFKGFGNRMGYSHRGLRSSPVLRDSLPPRRSDIWERSYRHPCSTGAHSLRRPRPHRALPLTGVASDQPHQSHPARSRKVHWCGHHTTRRYEAKPR